MISQLLFTGTFWEFFEIEFVFVLLFTKKKKKLVTPVFINQRNE